jgi:hypothetical protein
MTSIYWWWHLGLLVWDKKDKYDLMHFQRKQNHLLWNGGPWKLLFNLDAKRFIRKKLRLNKLWNIPPTFCNFHKLAYSTTSCVHVVFYKFSSSHANNLTQVFCGLYFLPFYFSSKLCTSHLCFHSCYYTCHSQGTLFVCIICAL